MGVSEVSQALLSQLHPLEVKVLPHLKDGQLLSALAKKAKIQEVEAMRALQWLQNKKALDFEKRATQRYELGKNGKKALKEGLPEARFYDALKKGAKTRDQVLKKGKLDPQEFGASVGILKRLGVLKVKGESYTLSKGKHSGVGDGTIKLLQKLQKKGAPTKDEEKIVQELKKRKEYLITITNKDYKITLTDLGKKLVKTDLKKLKFEERLTKDDLETGAWKKKQYRAYDVTANVPSIHAGKIHFIQEAINYIRKIWVEMGFTEHGGDLVQPAFWDLDALFVPQDHPARETQDTFYLEEPERVSIERAAYEQIRAVHEDGGTTKSEGWQYEYSKEEAERLLLLTHDTVFSARTLWDIRRGKAKMPGKYFAVSKVFRNEKMDWKHLFEFHQIGGIVVDKDVNFAQLIGYLKIFFAKMGFPKVRVRPHNFPYTEPSVEVDVWNPKKKQWVELGGAGVFRPEVTKPLIGEEVPVLAWGLGMERIIVEYFDLHDLRDLYRNDIKQLREMKRFLKIDEVEV